MARGTVVGERVVSQATTREYEAGHERVFGSGSKVKRGRWIWDPDAQRLIPIEEFVPRYEARNAPIIADRAHEGTISPVDGSDIGSRRKRREHMKKHDLIDATDISPRYREQEAKFQERQDDRKRREAMVQAARKLYSQGKWE
jgi:hypothetical protein